MSSSDDIGSRASAPWIGSTAGCRVALRSTGKAATGREVGGGEYPSRMRSLAARPLTPGAEKAVAGDLIESRDYFERK
ncbi:unnamed protein product [Lampetra planeri]